MSFLIKFPLFLIVGLLFSNKLLIEANSLHKNFDKSDIGLELFEKLFPYSLPTFLSDFLKHKPSIRELEDTIFVNVSDHCKIHTNHWLDTLSALDETNIWAIHLFDAFGKFPEGILAGHINAMGDFDECVGAKATNLELVGAPDEFSGRYCSAFITTDNFGAGSEEINEESHQFLPRKGVPPAELIDLIQLREGVMMNPSLAVCFPSTCDSGDISNIMINSFGYFNISGFKPLVMNCFTDTKPDLDNGDITVLVLLGVIFFICVLGTVLDLCRDADKKPSLGLQYFIAFSFYTNTKKWLSTRTTGDNLGCLHGLRFLSTSWVILAHTWYMITFIPMWNMIDVKNLPQNILLMTVLNGSLAVDSFFALSGLLVSFNVFKMLDKTRGKFNIPMFYLHRYLRLTPAYAILLAVMATLLPYAGSGPYWTIIDVWSEWCERNWWTNLVYLNNFIGVDQLCQGEAWYLANDFQFYILSPFIIYPIWKKPKLGLIFLGLLTVLSSISPALLTWHYDVVPTLIGTRDQGTVYKDIYIKPYARIQSYLVGIWTGYALFNTRGTKFTMSKLTNILGWAISTGASLAVLYGIYPWFNARNEIPEAASLAYAGLHRLAWSGAVCWMIFACCKGYGGFVNSFLSWKVFMPLGRLTFCAYLVSLHIQMIFHLSFRQPISYDNYSMTNFYFAHMVVSFGLAFICTIMFESPFMILVKLIFEGGERGPRPEAIKSPHERNGIFYNKTETIIADPIIEDKKE